MAGLDVQRFASPERLGETADRQSGCCRAGEGQPAAVDAGVVAAVRGVRPRHSCRWLQDHRRFDVQLPLHIDQLEELPGPDEFATVESLVGLGAGHEQRRQSGNDLLRRQRSVGVRDADEDRHPDVGGSRSPALGSVLGRLRLERWMPLAQPNQDQRASRCDALRVPRHSDAGAGHRDPQHRQRMPRGRQRCRRHLAPMPCSERGSGCRVAGRRQHQGSDRIDGGPRQHHRHRCGRGGLCDRRSVHRAARRPTHFLQRQYGARQDGRQPGGRSARLERAILSVPVGADALHRRRPRFLRACRFIRRWRDDVHVRRAATSDGHACPVVLRADRVMHRKGPCPGWNGDSGRGGRRGTERCGDARQPDGHRADICRLPHRRRVFDTGGRSADALQCELRGG